MFIKLRDYFSIQIVEGTHRQIEYSQIFKINSG